MGKKGKNKAVSFLNGGKQVCLWSDAVGRRVTLGHESGRQKEESSESRKCQSACRILWVAIFAAGGLDRVWVWLHLSPPSRINLVRVVAKIGVIKKQKFLFLFGPMRCAVRMRWPARSRSSVFLQNNRHRVSLSLSKQQIDEAIAKYLCVLTLRLDLMRSINLILG